MDLSSKIGPHLSLELLEALDELYPNRCPNPLDSERDIWMKAGERRVIDVLWAKFNEQQEGQVLNVLR